MRATRQARQTRFLQFGSQVLSVIATWFRRALAGAMEHVVFSQLNALDDATLASCRRVPKTPGDPAPIVLLLGTGLIILAVAMRNAAASLAGARGPT